MKESEIAKRHTAEHIFMRTLTNLLENVRVVKVEHKEDVNKIYLEADSLSWNDVIEASIITNKIIRENRSVRIEFYESLDDAKKVYDDIRAYESRISGKVRLVIIEDYDISACKMPHVSSTGECIMFLPIGLSKVKGKLYEVRYFAGEDAIYKSIEYIGILIDILRKYNVSIDKIYRFLENLEMEKKKLGKAVKELSEYIVYNSRIEGSKVRYMYINQPYIDMESASKAVAKILGKLIDIAVIISYDDERYRLLIASSSDIDAVSLGKELIKVSGGRGGGRKGWFMGYIEDIDEAESFLGEYLSGL